MTTKPNDLGFGTVSKLDVSGFEHRKPTRASSREDDDAADRAAEKQGFVSREPIARVERVRKAKEPLDHAYVRGPISMINRFKKHCNETGKSYGEVLDELMKKAGI